MYIARVLALSVTIFAGGGPSIGQAQTVAETIKKWGLLGSWSVDCNAPVADIGSGRLSYQIRKGKPVQVRNLGKDGEDMSDISRAKIGPDGSLEVRIENKASNIGTWDITWVRGPDGRKRAKVSRKADGTYVIRDEKFVSNGNPTSWQTLCR